MNDIIDLFEASENPVLFICLLDCFLAGLTIGVLLRKEDDTMLKLEFDHREGKTCHWTFHDTGESSYRGPPKEMRHSVNSFIISDLHMGTPSCRARALMATLNTFWFERIILLGDIFENLNLKRLSGAQWKVLSRIRKLTDPDRDIEEVWVEGNHDYDIGKVMSDIVGIPVYKEFLWEFRGKKYCAIHGDQFDHFINNSPRLTRFIIFLYQYIQKCDPKHRHIGHYLARKSREWLRESELVAAGALKHARRHDADVIFCGHTHEVFHREADGTTYYNTGCWVKNPCSFVTIDHEGVVTLNLVHLEEKNQPPQET